MVRPDMTREPRVLRAASAIVGVTGIALLSGCSGTPGDAATADGIPSGTDYADGTYTAEGSYLPPRGEPETITVTVTLQDNIVQSVVVEGTPNEPETKLYQGQFVDGISAVVVGKPIDELNVGIVSGSSLTSGGFNAAIEEIKAEAAVG